jgi:hypothetical protein
MGNRGGRCAKRARRVPRLMRGALRTARQRLATRSARDTLVGLGVVAAVAAVVLGPHVFAGGFHADDWVDTGLYRFHRGHGFWAAVDSVQGSKQGRDAWGFVRATEAALFGLHSARYLAVVAVAALVEGGLFLVLARRLGAPAGPAAMAALLLLLLPAADSTRLWATGLIVTLFAGCCLLAGVLVALRGLELPGLRGAATHAGALVLYALSVNGYELGAPLILLAGVLYLRRAPRRAALWRWAADAVVVGAVLWRYSLNRHASPSSLDAALEHARLIGDSGLHVAERALFPFGDGAGFGVLVVALVLCGSAGIGTALLHEGELRAGLRRGLGLVAAGVVVAVAGWVMIVPADLGYDPGAAGVGNRVNGVAAMGLAILVCGMAVLLAAPLRAALRGRASQAVIVTLLLAPVGAADAVELGDDADHWNRAANLNRLVLKRMRQLVPSPPADSTLYTFGVPGYSAPSVPIFGGGGNQDLFWAARLTYGTAGVGAFPVLGGMTFTCAERTMSLNAAAPVRAPRYGRAFLVDIVGGRVITPRNRAECLRETAGLMPYARVNERD